ncbi:MAG TPA: DUF5664 domain-containing protein [Acidocella sp.]|nr:DUF5664 domain-containing protein [Acidocella sp.]
MAENPKEAAGRLKTPVHLVPPALILATAEVLKHGASVYGEWNWRDAGIVLSTYTGAAMRHLLAIMDGQDIDPESGQSHWAHIAANCAIVLDAAPRGMVKDDRKPSV